MKAAKSFARRVRSKSPFRRRKQADTLIAEVREKEKTYSRQLHPSQDQATQPQDQAEIEVVLESSSLDVATATATQSEHSSYHVKTPPRKENVVPELAPSSSASTDDPALTNAQAAARRFMERQQKIAAGNRRKSFRDRFMRSAKNDPAPPPPPSPAQSTKDRGIAVRGRSARSTSSSSVRSQGNRPQERGRSKERTTRGGLVGRRSSQKSKASRSSSRKRGGFTSLMDEDDPDVTSNKRPGASVEQPISIDVAVQSRVSELSTPAAIIRQESLGNESIRGVRQALQKMEMELAAAGDAGKRVSRDRIMNALNYMAHSLHYDDQKEALVKELDAWIDESVIGKDRARVYADEEDDDDENSDDDTSSSDASGSTFDLDAFEEGRSRASVRERQTQSSFQDLFQRLGKFFTVSEEDKTAVRQALDDLLWTELVGKQHDPSTRSSRSSKREDDSESSDDSIGNFDPLSCNIQDTKFEPAAPTRGRSWWRRHGIGIGSTNAKKENLYPVQEGPPSPESKISVPSPTGRVNPRSSKSKGSGGSKSKGSGKTSGSGKSPRVLLPPPNKKSALKERAPTTQRFKMDGSDSGWSSFDDTASDFWRQGDRYTIPSQPKASTQQAQLVNQYKLSYPPSWQDSDPFLDSDFVAPKVGSDDFSDWDNCRHPPENLTHQQRPPPM